MSAKQIRGWLWLGLILIAAGCGREKPPGPTGAPLNVPTILLTSRAFEAGATIPTPYTCDGEDLSPPLHWGAPPAGTQSLALIADDPDAPGKTWVHWVVYDLPPDLRDLSEGVPDSETLPEGGTQGKNDFGNIGYGGPCPPKGGPHRYFFKLYALDTVLNLPPGATKAELLTAMSGHIVAEGELMGTYSR